LCGEKRNLSEKERHNERMDWSGRERTIIRKSVCALHIIDCDFNYVKCNKSDQKEPMTENCNFAVKGKAHQGQSIFFEEAAKLTG